MDRWTNGLMDRGDYNIPIAFLKKRGDNKYLIYPIYFDPYYARP